MPIAKVQLPDGRIAKFEVPEGTSPDEVIAFAQSQKFSAPKEPNFQQRMAQDYAERKAQVAAAEAAQPTNELAISKPLQVVGANLGLVGDTLGNVLGSGARYLGDAGRAVFGEIDTPSLPEDSILTNNMVVRGAKNILSSDIQMYKDWAKSHPEAAANIGAVGNIAVNAPLLKPLAAGAQLAGKGAIQGGKAIAKPLEEGVRNLSAGTVARGTEDLREVVKDLKSSAVGLKNQAKLSEIKLLPAEGVNISRNIDKALEGTELIPEFSPKTLKVVQLIKEKAATGDLNLNNLDQYRRLLRSAYDEDSVAAGAVKRAIDDTVNNLSTAGRRGESVNLLNQFRKDYSQASKFEDISEIAIKAEGDSQKIRKGIKNFLDKNPNLEKTYSKRELGLLKAASKSSKPQMLLRSLGTFGLDIGKTKNIAFPALMAGSSVAVPGGLPLVVAGTAARQAEKALARGKLERALRELETSGGKAK